MKKTMKMAMERALVMFAVALAMFAGLAGAAPPSGVVSKPFLAGPGGVARTYQDKLADAVNVKDYGAKCNGVADDTAAFQRALDAARVIGIPTGTCVLSSVNLKSNTTLYGQGDATILKQIPGPRGMLHADSGSPLVANNFRKIVVRDVLLRGSVDVDGFHEHTHLMSLNGVTEVLIERVTFLGFRGDGLYLGSSQVAGTERHNVAVTVRNSVFDGINNDNRNGISIIDGDGVTIEDNRFVNLTRSNMPGAVDLEPNAETWPVIRNVTIRNNKFHHVGGSVGTVAVYVPGTVTGGAKNIIVENNVSTDYIGTGSFFFFSDNRLPTFVGDPNNVKLLNNTASNSTGGPFMVYGKGIQIIGNVFKDFSGAAYLAYLDKFAVRDVDIIGNHMIRVGKSGGNGLTIFEAHGVSIVGNYFTDNGTGAAGASNAIDFSKGTSSGIRLERNVFMAPDAKTQIAIQKEGLHTFTPSTNKFVGNTVQEQLLNWFQADETDAMERTYLPVVAGSTAAGTGTYTKQYGRWYRIGKRVFFRVQVEVDAGHTGTAMVQISLPVRVRAPSGGELWPVSVAANGLSTTGGQMAVINASAVVDGVTGAVRLYHSQTGAMAQTLMSAAAFTVYVSGSYETI